MNDVQYLTADGARRLREELEYLTGIVRQQISERLRSAISQGDLSENADYTVAKEEQSFAEGRIQELEYVLKNAVVIDDRATNREIVNVGAHITVQEENFPAETYHLVGAKEADPQNARISHESPIGKALMGHRVGDTVCTETPAGKICIKILKIE
jgi:transcription elongation factor GreA